ncbi:MAG: hypothetical protein DRH57_05295 [Candidatus Cloacimonadota bacterium]|nr:MAG: hypothetical protein DRH57_05295 [Candidatus Cloacimonadota bacterium]
MIILTASESDENSNLDNRFARCKFFAVYDEEKNSYSFYENNTENVAHGAGPQAVQKILKLGSNVLITGNIGPKAMDVLQSSKISVFQGLAEKSIKENIQAYKDGLLEQINTSIKGTYSPKNY